MEGLNISLYWVCASPRSFTDAITSEQSSEFKVWCIGFILDNFRISALKTHPYTSEVNLIHYHAGSLGLSWTRLSLKDFQVSTTVHRIRGVGLWQFVSRLPCVKGFFDVVEDSWKWSHHFRSDMVPSFNHAIQHFIPTRQNLSWFGSTSQTFLCTFAPNFKDILKYTNNAIGRFILENYRGKGSNFTFPLSLRCYWSIKKPSRDHKDWI